MPTTDFSGAFVIALVLAFLAVIGWTRASRWKRLVKRMERGQILDSPASREATILAGEEAAHRLNRQAAAQPRAVQSELQPVKTKGGKGSGRHAVRGGRGRFKPIG